MDKIDIRKLWNEDINYSDRLTEFLNEAFNGDGFLLLPKVRLSKYDPPVFLYQESRGEDNYVNTFTYYGGKGEQAQAGVGARNELKISRYISAKDRGEILSFFSQIEFCLEVLVCITQGVFEGAVEYKRLQRQFIDDNGSFSTTQRKVNYLEDFQVLSPETVKLLKKARLIRNVLGHQYLPQKNVGLEDKEVALYTSLSEAIERIYTATWFYLLKDYVKQQDQVAAWLAKRAPPGAARPIQ